MSTTNLLLDVLKKNPKASIDYFSQVALGEKTDIHFGFVQNSVSITFVITGKSKGKELCISKKLEHLFDSSSNLEPLDNYLPSIKQPLQYRFCPYLKINDEPEMYACQIGIEHKVD